MIRFLSQAEKEELVALRQLARRVWPSDWEDHCVRVTVNGSACNKQDGWWVGNEFSGEFETSR